jgi:lipopolysaccharide/colanic/teichoic acid biosynthesis glycosyltransferase
MKRIFDILGSFLALVIFSPLLILLYFKIKKQMGSPVLFHQDRPGLNGKPFKMVKFRSMKDDLDSNGNTIQEEDRITPLGAKLRSSSLDELPEFWNVLKGEMSLVGPRPLLMRYLPLYSTEQARRNLVRPGITGWAQINGRNELSWEEKFKLDVWYVDNQSLILDLKILFLTVKKVLIKDGINTSDDSIMPEFTGTEKNKGAP